MPELPDVEVFRRYVNATALHQQIEDVDVRAPEMLKGVSPLRLRSRMLGHSLETTNRYGKYLFARLSGNGWLALHFGMTGFMAYFKDWLTISAHPRLVLSFSNGHHLAYDCQRKLGMVGLIEDPAAFVRRKGLGPDALEADLSVEDVRRLFAGRRARVKAALMNQGLIAGIGNLYADEILFQARIHPLARVGSLDQTQLRALLQSMKSVLGTAIRCQADAGRMPRSWLLLHRDPSGSCPRCRKRVRRMKLVGRTCYFCGACQAGRGT